MKKICLVCLLCAPLCWCAADDALARGLYVRDRVNIPLKRNANENSQVIGMASTNDYLEVKEEGGEWVKVTTPDGQEGWVPVRLLTTETPRALIIEQLNDKMKAYAENLKAVQDQNKALEKENRELKFQVGSLTSDVDKSKSDYVNLREASTTYLDLKADYDRLVAADKERVRKLDELSKEYSRLKTSERVKFSLVGGGFIMIGIILGGLMQTLRGKPKKSGYKM